MYFALCQYLTTCACTLHSRNTWPVQSTHCPFLITPENHLKSLISQYHRSLGNQGCMCRGNWLPHKIKVSRKPVNQPTKALAGFVNHTTWAVKPTIFYSHHGGSQEVRGISKG